VQHADIAIVGAGAAGLMTSIVAARAAPRRSIVLLDGATRLGAKILVSGGGRCNVTHDEVDERAFAGSTGPSIRKVLRRFDVPQTIRFFRDLGVRLKREETGKLFPTDDRARSVLDALLGAARGAGVRIINPWRVASVARHDGAFLLGGPAGELRAARLVIATGGMSLPKTGSDGHGYHLVRTLGHTVTPRLLPALVPLTVAEGHFVRGLSGISTPAVLQVRSASGRRLASLDGPVLCTHFGVSGPGPMDISRYFLDAAADDPAATLVVNWLPGQTAESADAALSGLGRAGPGRWLRQHLPQRLADAICVAADLDPAAPADRLTRPRRQALARALCDAPLPITGSRGFAHAEVTAGGVPLRELNLSTMESRRCHGLYLVGEICDVDGRIGGYNFQWAWASGQVAGLGLAAAADSAAPLGDNGGAARGDPLREPRVGPAAS
jgi:hypothetical protein